MSPRPLKVFLCHAHSDKNAVRDLYLRLTKDGVDVWLDKEKLLPGQDWESEIRQAVRESDVVVVCHSKQFNQKGFRQKEVRIALEEADLLPKGEIYIIPARLEECDVLEDLVRWQWVDLFVMGGYDALIRALRRQADKLGATLQAHKSWLPKITTPRAREQKPIKPKANDQKKSRIVGSTVELPDDVPPTDQFPSGWDDEWRPSFDERPDSKPVETQKPRKNDPILFKFIIPFIVIGLLGLLIVPRLINFPQPLATLVPISEQIYIAEIYNLSLSMSSPAASSIRAIQQGDLLNFGSGVTLKTSSGSGYAFIGLPGQTQLYLDDDTEIIFTDFTEMQSKILLDKGSILVNQPGRKFLVESPNGAQAWISGYYSMMGLHYDLNTQELYVDCLQGTCWYSDNQPQSQGFYVIMKGLQIVDVGPGTHNVYWQFIPALVPTPTLTTVTPNLQATQTCRYLRSLATPCPPSK